MVRLLLLVVFATLFSTVACDTSPVVTPAIESPTLTTPLPTEKAVNTLAPPIATVTTPLPTEKAVSTVASPVATVTTPMPTEQLVATESPTITAEPTLAPTPAPTSEPTPTSEPPALGTRDNPVPFGQVVEILEGDKPHWAIVVSDVNFDAFEMLLQAYPQNPSPEPGHRFVMVKIEVKYLGSDSTWFGNRYFVRAVGQSGVVYEEYCDTSYTHWFDPTTELFTGGAIDGWICFPVSIADVDSLQFMVDKYFSDQRVWFNLR